MQISDFITRLRAECPTLQNQVFGSIELADTLQKTIRPPCAFVVPMAEKSEFNSLMGGFSQRITAQIGVVICVKNYKEERGDAEQTLLETIRHEIRAALCGWEAPNTANVVEFSQGQLAAYDNNIMRWNDVFLTHYYYRK